MNVNPALTNQEKSKINRDEILYLYSFFHTSSLHFSSTRASFILRSIHRISFIRHRSFRKIKSIKASLNCEIGCNLQNFITLKKKMTTNPSNNPYGSRLKIFAECISIIIMLVSLKICGENNIANLLPLYKSGTKLIWF